MSGNEPKEIYRALTALAKDIILKANPAAEVAEIATTHTHEEKRLKIAKLSLTIAERFVDLEQGLLANHMYTEEEAQLEIRELEEELARKHELERKIEECSKRWSNMLEEGEEGE